MTCKNCVNLRLVIETTKQQKQFFKEAWLGSKKIVAQRDEKIARYEKIVRAVESDIRRMEQR